MKKRTLFSVILLLLAGHANAVPPTPVVPGRNGLPACSNDGYVPAYDAATGRYVCRAVGLSAETTVSAGTCSTSYNIDPANGTMVALTLDGACQIGVTGIEAGRSFIVYLTQAGTTAPTFTAAYRWPQGTMPSWSTAQGKYDMFSCVCFDGSTLLCNGTTDVR